MQTFIHAPFMDFIHNNMGNTFQVSIYQQSPQQDASSAEQKARIPSSHSFQPNFVANLM
jgi:flagellar hook-length control protein FliK